MRKMLPFYKGVLLVSLQLCLLSTVQCVPAPRKVEAVPLNGVPEGIIASQKLSVPLIQGSSNVVEETNGQEGVVEAENVMVRTENEPAEVTSLENITEESDSLTDENTAERSVAGTQTIENEQVVSGNLDSAIRTDTGENVDTETSAQEMESAVSRSVDEQGIVNNEKESLPETINNTVEHYVRNDVATNNGAAQGIQLKEQINDEAELSGTGRDAAVEPNAEVNSDNGIYEDIRVESNVLMNKEDNVKDLSLLETERNTASVEQEQPFSGEANVIDASEKRAVEGASSSENNVQLSSEENIARDPAEHLETTDISMETAETINKSAGGGTAQNNDPVIHQEVDESINDAAAIEVENRAAQELVTAGSTENNSESMPLEDRKDTITEEDTGKTSEVDQIGTENNQDSKDDGTAADIAQMDGSPHGTETTNQNYPENIQNLGTAQQVVQSNQVPESNGQSSLIFSEESTNDHDPSGDLNIGHESVKTETLDSTVHHESSGNGIQGTLSQKDVYIGESQSNENVSENSDSSEVIQSLDQTENIETGIANNGNTEFGNSNPDPVVDGEPKSLPNSEETDDKNITGNENVDETHNQQGVEQLVTGNINSENNLEFASNEPDSSSSIIHEKEGHSTETNSDGFGFNKNEIGQGNRAMQGKETQQEFEAMPLVADDKKEDESNEKLGVFAQYATEHSENERNSELETAGVHAVPIEKDQDPQEALQEAEEKRRALARDPDQKYENQPQHMYTGYTYRPLHANSEQASDSNEGDKSGVHETKKENEPHLGSDGSAHPAFENDNVKEDEDEDDGELVTRDFKNDDASHLHSDSFDKEDGNPVPISSDQDIRDLPPAHQDHPHMRGGERELDEQAKLHAQLNLSKQSETKSSAMGVFHTLLTLLFLAVASKIGYKWFISNRNRRMYVRKLRTPYKLDVNV